VDELEESEPPPQPVARRAAPVSRQAKTQVYRRSGIRAPMLFSATPVQPSP